MEIRRAKTALTNGGAAPFPPAAIAALLLQKINPAASDAFANRDQLNALMASFVPTIMKRSICAKDTPPTAVPAGLDGTQFIAMRFFIEGKSAPPVDKPPPTLVIRTECDFVQWRSARDYRDRLKAQLVYIEGAGHALWPYRADIAKEVLAAFFHGEQLPLPSYDGEKDPADK